MQSIKKQERDHSTWLIQYKESSRRQAMRAWQLWTGYMDDKDEAWILGNLHTEDWGAHLVNFHRWLKKQPLTRGTGTLSDNTAISLSSMIRGYLMHVGATLTLSKAQKQELTMIQSKPHTDFPMNIKVKEKLMGIAGPIEDYILCAGISFGLRTNDFLKIRRGMLEPLIEDQEVPIQLAPIQTMKRGVSAQPFIDRDAYTAIQTLFKEMDKEGRTDPDEPMLIFTSKDPDTELNKILKNLFKKAGINTGEMIVRFHILRKFLTDQLAAICSGDKWKHFVGKKAKSPYVNSEGRAAYTKVMDFTCINHENIGGVANVALATKVEELSQEIEWMKHDHERTGSLLQHLMEDVLSREQRAKMKKFIKEHFGEEYPNEEKKNG